MSSKCGIRKLILISSYDFFIFMQTDSESDEKEKKEKDSKPGKHSCLNKNLLMLNNANAKQCLC